MVRPVPQNQKSALTENSSGAPAAGANATPQSADGTDPFAEDVTELLREAQEIPPSPKLWRRIKAALAGRSATVPCDNGGAGET